MNKFGSEDRLLFHLVISVQMIIYTCIFQAAGASNMTSCGKQNFTAIRGNIVSPNHPQTYPTNFNCNYDVYVKDALKIVLYLDTFLLEEAYAPENGSLHQCPDGVIFAGNGINTTLCGNKSGTEFSVCSDKVHLHFFTDRSSVSAGFNITYEAVYTQTSTHIETTTVPSGAASTTIALFETPTITDSKLSLSTQNISGTTLSLLISTSVKHRRTFKTSETTSQAQQLSTEMTSLPVTVTHAKQRSSTVPTSFPITTQTEESPTVIDVDSSGRYTKTELILLITLPSAVALISFVVAAVLACNRRKLERHEVAESRHYLDVDERQQKNVELTDLHADVRGREENVYI